MKQSRDKPGQFYTPNALEARLPLDPAAQADALWRLRARLAFATDLIEEQGDNGRRGIHASMLAVREYLMLLGVPPPNLYALELVATAVVDATAGVTTPAFKPDKRPARPPLSGLLASPRALQAAVVECCIRSKKREGVKAFRIEGGKLAEKLLREAKWKPLMTAKQLLNLREEVSARPEGDRMRATYASLTDEYFADVEPLLWAKVIVQNGSFNKIPKAPDPLS